MRRRRWTARAAALCLAIVVVLQLAVVDGAAAAGPGPGRPLPSRRLRGHVQRALPSPSSSSSLHVVHHVVAKARGGGRAVAFHAADEGARCKSSKAQNDTGVRGAGCAGDGDDDDKRVVPTGPNPLHNR